MKKILLTLAVAAVTLAASAFNEFPLAQGQLGAPMNLKKATPEMVNKLAAKTLAARAPKKMNNPVTVASDLEGSYVWSFEQASSRNVDPTAVTGTAGTSDVLIYGADDAAGTFKVAGMFDAPITGTLDLTSYDYPTFTLSDEEDVAYATITVSGQSVEIQCTVAGLFYYEGDTSNQAGWYFTDNLAFVIDGEIIFATNVWMSRVISHVITDGYSQYEGYSLNPVWKPGSEMAVSQTTYNGLTTYNYGGLDMAFPATITEDENYVVTVNNFAGLAENPVNFTLQEGRTWTADHPVLFSTTNGSFVFYGLDAEASNLLDVTGTGTDTELTFDCTWTGYDTETNYWLGQRNPATVTLLDGKYVYPGEEEAPKYYLIGSFNNWDGATMEELTLGDDGKYTITKALDAGVEFKLKDDAGNWIGAESNGNFIVTKEQVQQGTAITMGAGDVYQNVQIPVAGEWTLTYDPEASTLTIAGEWPVEDIIVEGLVTDEAGQPLADVNVTISTIADVPAGLMRAAGDNFTGVTDSEGKYTITVTPTEGATYNATFEKEDYETQTIENVDLNNMPTVVLVSEVTGVFDINAAKNVVSVKFINAAGQVSNNAFNGMNIQVIRYTDGTIKTVKVVK